MRRRWKTWTSALALVLLALGVGAMLCPTANVAERRTVSLREGMTWDEVMSVLAPSAVRLHQGRPSARINDFNTAYTWGYGDGSTLVVTFGIWDGCEPLTFCSFRTEPAPPADAMPLLRRTLARVVPALGDGPPAPVGKPF